MNIIEYDLEVRYAVQHSLLSCDIFIMTMKYYK